MAWIVGNNSANNIVGKFLGDHISGLAGNDVIDVVGEMMRSVATAATTTIYAGYGDD